MKSPKNNYVRKLQYTQLQLAYDKCYAFAESYNKVIQYALKHELLTKDQCDKIIKGEIS